MGKKRVPIAVLSTFAAFAGFTSSAPAALPPPVVGKTFQASRVSGTVYVTQPHGSKTALTGSEDVAVGSTFDVTKGSVKLTASNGKGGTYSGSFGAQAGAPSPQEFRALQSATGSTTTEIKLITALSCSKQASDVSQRHRRYYRAITITAGKDFLVVGLSVSASSKTAVAHYTLVDQCDGTHISDNSGKVAARDKQGQTQPTLNPGESEITYCASASGGRSYCLYLDSQPDVFVFSFGLGLINYGHASHWERCFKTPQGKNVCQTFALSSSGALQHGSRTCSLNYGAGKFPTRWLFKGQQIGPTETLVATQPYDPQVAYGVHCYGP